MGDLLLGDFEEEDNYSDDPIFYEELPFSDVPTENWDLCENCNNYRPCGCCALDMHKVNPDESCSYNMKRGRKNG